MTHHSLRRLLLRELRMRFMMTGGGMEEERKDEAEEEKKREEGEDPRGSQQASAESA
jgi:hypothetical protein